VSLRNEVNRIRKTVEALPRQSEQSQEFLARLAEDLQPEERSILEELLRRAETKNAERQKQKTPREPDPFHLWTDAEKDCYMALLDRAIARFDAELLAAGIDPEELDDGDDPDEDGDDPDSD
jgi:hypothetical protein